MTKRKKLLIVFAVLTILGAICDKQVPYKPDAKIVDAVDVLSPGDERVTIKNSWWAENRKDLDVLSGYFQNKDYSAVSKLMASNRVFKMQEPQTVFITEVKIWDGQVKIRPAGQAFELWMHINSFENPK